MRYRIKKETKPTLPTYGKYKAVAVHYQTIDSRQIAEEATRGMTISAGVLEGILMNVAEVVRRHLRNGDKVRLKDIGLLKLEIESEKVDNLKDFRAKKHIRGVRLHLIFQKVMKAPKNSIRTSPSRKIAITWRNRGTPTENRTRN